MAEYPNEASRKSKTEGDRWSSENDSMRDRTDEQAGGITNRPLDEEVSNQESLPSRGESKRGAHAGHGGGDAAVDMDLERDDRRSER
jgi:hypothetical protein